MTTGQQEPKTSLGMLSDGFKQLPAERRGIVHDFYVGGVDFTVMVGVYEDGRPGEIFLRATGKDSPVGMAGMLEVVARLVTITLQCGVPLAFLADQFINTNFEPSGWSSNPKIPYAKSVVDYVFQWLLEFKVEQPPSDQLPLFGDGEPTVPICAECHTPMTPGSGGVPYICKNCNPLAAVASVQ